MKEMPRKSTLACDVQLLHQATPLCQDSQAMQSRLLDEKTNMVLSPWAPDCLLVASGRATGKPSFTLPPKRFTPQVCRAQAGHLNYAR